MDGTGAGMPEQRPERKGVVRRSGDKNGEILPLGTRSSDESERNAGEAGCASGESGADGVSLIWNGTESSFTVSVSGLNAPNGIKELKAAVCITGKTFLTVMMRTGLHGPESAVKMVSWNWKRYRFLKNGGRPVI